MKQKRTLLPRWLYGDYIVEPSYLMMWISVVICKIACTNFSYQSWLLLFGQHRLNCIGRLIQTCVSFPEPSLCFNARTMGRATLSTCSWEGPVRSSRMFMPKLIPSNNGSAMRHKAELARCDAVYATWSLLIATWPKKIAGLSVNEIKRVQKSIKLPVKVMYDNIAMLCYPNR